MTTLKEALNPPDLTKFKKIEVPASLQATIQFNVDRHRANMRKIAEPAVLREANDSSSSGKKESE